MPRGLADVGQAPWAVQKTWGEKGRMAGFTWLTSPRHRRRRAWEAEPSNVRPLYEAPEKKRGRPVPARCSCAYAANWLR